MTPDPRWRALLDALEQTLEDQRIDGGDAAAAHRLVQAIAQRAALQGHLVLAELAAAAQHPDDLPGVLDPLREVAWPCVHRRGKVCVVAEASVVEQVHAALRGLEHRVLPTDADGFFDRLDDDDAAALVVAIDGPHALDLLVRLALDPRGERVPVVALLADPVLRTQAVGLGAAATLRLPLDEQTVTAAVATLLGQGGFDRLHGRTAFTRTYADVRADARHDGEGCAVLVAHPLGIANARQVHGEAFGERLLLAAAEHLRDHIGTLSRVHALDRDTLAWVSRAPRSALHTRLAEITAGQGRAVRTPGSTPWYNRMAIGGVEVGDLPMERALQGARRMLALAVQAGGAAPVVTPLEAIRGTRPRALVFEPDPAVAERLLRIVDRAGLEAVRVDSALDAMASAQTGPFAIGLVAVHGPMGIRLVKGLHATLPVVWALTDDSASSRAALQHGADDVVSSPLDAALLTARLQARLRRSDPRP